MPCRITAAKTPRRDKLKYFKKLKTLGSRTYAIGLGFVGLIIGVAVNIPTTSFAFEPGQRWSCVTDQGEQAFLAVLDVNGEAVSFSWGVVKSDNSLNSLCNKRDELSVEEMGEFCQLLGTDFSEGHVRLDESCAAKGNQ